jgi:sn-glycerol 3-phosphate transport system substrate-binding protein
MTTTWSRRGLTALLLAAALLVAACSSDDGGGSASDDSLDGAAADLPECPLDALDEVTEPVDVLLWHAYGAKTEEALEALAAEYNASQDQVVVRVENQGSSYEELQRQFTGAIQSGDLPNVTVAEDTQLQFMADSGVVLPATSCYEAGAEQLDFLPGPISYFSLDGVQWPAVFNLSSPLLYFNAGHFEDAGLDPADPPQTLAEVQEVAQALKDAGVSEAPLALVLSPWYFETWLTGIGETVVDEENGRAGVATEATLDDGAFLDLLTWVDDMNQAGLLEPVVQTDGQLDQFLALAQQNSSMLIESSAAATAIEAFLRGDLAAEDLTDDDRVILSDDLELDVDVRSTPLPGIEQPGQVQVGGAAFYVTTTGTPAQQAGAWDFLEFLNTVPSQVTNNLTGSYLPSRVSSAEDPQLQETWETTLSGGFLAQSYEQLLEVDPDFPGPVIGPYTDMREIIRAGLEALVLEGATPEDVAADIQAQVTEALATYEEQSF